MALLFTARIKCADCGATRAVSSYGDLWSGKCGCGLRLQVYVDGQTCNASCLDLFPQTGPEHDVRKRGRDPADRASRRDPSPSALRSHAKGYAILPDGWYPSHSGLRTSVPASCTDDASPQKALKELGRDLHEWFAALPAAQKIERLKASGILDRQGKLSSSYGGEGESTRSGHQPGRPSTSG